MKESVSIMRLPFTAILINSLILGSCNPKEANESGTGSDSESGWDEPFDWIAHVTIHPVAEGGSAGLGVWEYEVSSYGYGGILRVDITADRGGIWEESHELDCKACDYGPGRSWRDTLDVVPLEQFSIDTVTLYAPDDYDYMTWMFTVFSSLRPTATAPAFATWSSCVTTGKDPSLFESYGCAPIEPKEPYE